MHHTPHEHFKKVVEGLQLLVQYPGSSISVEQDQIWAGPFEEDVGLEDKEKLEQLGWFIDEDCYSKFV